MPTLAVIWRAAGLLFATGVDTVIEVLPPVAWTPAPAVPVWVRGLFCHRGNLVPLVDVSRLLQGEPLPDRMANRVVVARCSLVPGTVPSTVGLWVECVMDLERLVFDGAGTHPGFDTEGGRFLGRVVQTPWGQVQSINPGEIFSPEQSAVLAERLKEAAA